MEPKKAAPPPAPVSYPMSKIPSIDYVASSPALPIVPLSVNRSESANSGHFLFQTDFLTNSYATHRGAQWKLFPICDSGYALRTSKVT